ncbi:MAG: hypothetical protein DRP99_03800 [Candidatus Latescibacterota bacterium]|nr:MAG: hypothetical protein DRP99_03800 [Candidatus Latescibacterota bacterium]
MGGLGDTGEHPQVGEEGRKDCDFPRACTEEREGGARLQGHVQMVKLRISTVIFDLDGTLVDTEPDIRRAVDHALGEMGFPPASPERVRKGIGPGSETFAKIMLPEGGKERWEEWLFRYRRYYTEHCAERSRPFPGVPEMLEELRSLCRIAVATNKPRYMAERILDKLKLSRFVDLVVGPEDVSRIKPDPEMLELVLTRLRGEPLETLVVGDTDNDISAGKSLGALTCGVTWGYFPEPELRRLGPDFLADRPKDVVRIVEIFEEVKSCAG